jgi:hypothetical protein
MKELVEYWCDISDFSACRETNFTLHLTIGNFVSGNRDVDKATVILACQFLSCLDIFVNGNLNVRESFFFCGSLRPAARQTGTRDTVTFLGMAESDAIVCHGSNGTPLWKRRQ